MPSCCRWLRRSRGSLAKNKKHENRREFSNTGDAVTNVYECESDEYADIPLSPSTHNVSDENAQLEGEGSAPLDPPPAINRSSSTSPHIITTLPRAELLVKNSSSTTCTTTSNHGSNSSYHQASSPGERKPFEQNTGAESASTPRSISISIPSNEVESEHGTKSDKLKEKKSKFTFTTPSFSISSPISLHSKRSTRKSGNKGGLESEKKSSSHAQHPTSPSSREIKRIKSGESGTSYDDDDDIDAIKDYKIPVINGIEGLEDRYLKAVNLVIQPSDWTEVSAFRKYKVKACYHHVGGEAHAQLWMAIEIDQPIDKTMCLGNELDLWPKWNKVVTLNEPLEPLTTYNTKNRWLRSIAHGLYKTETLMDLRRFINHDHGFYLEHILPIDKKSPCWREKPEKGYYREELESALVLMPINDGKSTLWISYTQAQFPVPLNRWFGRIIIPTVCREIASQVLHGCAKIPTEEGKIWRDRIAEDRLKIYSELMQLPPQPYSLDNLPSLTKLWSQI